MLEKSKKKIKYKKFNLSKGCVELKKLSYGNGLTLKEAKTMPSDIEILTPPRRYIDF